MEQFTGFQKPMRRKSKSSRRKSCIRYQRHWQRNKHQILMVCRFRRGRTYPARRVFAGEFLEDHPTKEF